MTPARDLLRSGPLWGGLAGAVVLGVVAVRDPHVPGAFGACPFLAATGLPCAGCGGLRATHDLLHGDVGAALAQNALAVGLVLLAAVAWTRWAVRAAGRGPAGVSGPGATTTSTGVSSTLLLVVGVVVVVFTLVRWTPAGGVLGP
ncbi:hypothetical protein GCM10008944_02530 [Cytobacillus oceanisediminis]